MTKLRQVKKALTSAPVPAGPKPDATPDRTIKALNDPFFAELGVNKAECFATAEPMKAAIGIDSKDIDAIYRPAWVALKKSGFEPKTILELGTFMGYSTRFLAMLWPNAQIYTVDIPDSDPLYGAKWTPRRQFDEPNIHAVAANTVHILDQNLPNFDLIWLDAGHGFPSVAIDHVYCIHKLNPGGWLFTDDVTPPLDPVNRKSGPIYQTIEYIEARQNEKFRYLLQRESVEKWAEDNRRGTRKYVGYMRKG